MMMLENISKGGTHSTELSSQPKTQQIQPIVVIHSLLPRVFEWSWYLRKNLVNNNSSYYFPYFSTSQENRLSSNKFLSSYLYYLLINPDLDLKVKDKYYHI